MTKQQLDKELIEQGRNERDTQILSWFKMPIKYKENNQLGQVCCDVCGGKLFVVRSKYPHGEMRTVCPTCAIEILEQITSNLFPNNLASKVNEDQIIKGVKDIK
mgnify:CR=1 FL=1